MAIAWGDYCGHKSYIGNVYDLPPDVTFDYSTNSYHTRHQQQEINMLQNRILQSQVKKKADLDSIIGYFLMRK
jgi:hypothetical protein